MIAILSYGHRIYVALYYVNHQKDTCMVPSYCINFLPIIEYTKMYKTCFKNWRFRETILLFPINDFSWFKTIELNYNTPQNKSLIFYLLVSILKKPYQLVSFLLQKTFSCSKSTVNDHSFKIIEQKKLKL